MKHFFIINPAAGKGIESSPLLGAIRDACEVASADYEIYKTTARGDAALFVRNKIKQKPKDEIWRFYACGGDGTLSEVVSGAVNAKRDSGNSEIPGLEIGCIPIGTGNDFVRNFISPEFFCDITKQLLADTITIDCYSCGEDRYGINMINIGFDCDVVKAAELKKRRFMPKSLAYIAGVIALLRENPGRVIRVRREDGREITKEFQLVSAANGAWCGGGFNSAPRSALDDGLLDISLIDKVSRLDLIKLIGSYRGGKHLDTKLGKRIVEYTHAKAVVFEFSEPTNVCIDGEISVMDRLEVSVVPRAISFAVPVGCRVK